MTRRWSIPLIAMSCTLLLLCCTTIVAAESPRSTVDPALSVIRIEGYARLIACTVTAEFQCEGNDCTLFVRQVYQIGNGSKSQGAFLSLGLPASSTDLLVLSPLLMGAEGDAIAPVEGSPEYPVVWEVSLGPGAVRNLTLETQHALGARHLVHWMWSGSDLGGWGEIDGVLVQVRLPQPVTDEAVLSATPDVHRFDGRALVWEYELLRDPVQHELLLYAPPTLSALKRLQTDEAYRELAELYGAIDAEAHTSELSVPDHYTEIVGALQAARERDSGDIAAWLNLAAVYRARAEAQPDLRLGYLLLAAQELEHAAEHHPQDLRVTEEMIRIYHAVASEAHSQGDLAAATEYLSKADEAFSTSPPEVTEALAEPRLRLALQLAEQGSASETLNQIGNLLSPAVEQALLHYAPPLLAAHTTVELAPHMRKVTYSLRLYPPTAESTLNQIEGIRHTLHALGRIQTELTASPNTAELIIVVTWDSIDALQQTAHDLVRAIPAEGSLLRVLIAAPWQSNLRSFGIDANLWRTEYIYDESVNLASMQVIWEEALQYAQWRLEELAADTPNDERASLEQQFALMVLHEQDRLWKHLPHNSSWSYYVNYGSTQKAEPNVRAAVLWGQARDLQDSQTVYDWPLIQRIALVSLGVLGIALLVLLLRKPRA